MQKTIEITNRTENTKIIDIQHINMEIISSTEKIKQSLRSGNLCILETDTIPGIFADATDTESVRQIFTVKKRPFSKPLAIFLPSMDKIPGYGIETEASSEFCKKNLPGSYTILLKATEYAKNTLSHLTISQEGLIGIRIPDTQDILEIAKDIIICGTSVNISGKESVSNTTIPEEIAKHVQYYFTSQTCKGSGVPSTVIDFSAGSAKVIRI